MRPRRSRAVGYRSGPCVPHPRIRALVVFVATQRPTAAWGCAPSRVPERDSGTPGVSSSPVPFVNKAIASTFLSAMESVCGKGFRLINKTVTSAVSKAPLSWNFPTSGTAETEPSRPFEPMAMKVSLGSPLSSRIKEVPGHCMEFIKSDWELRVPLTFAVVCDSPPAKHYGLQQARHFSGIALVWMLHRRFTSGWYSIGLVGSP